MTSTLKFRSDNTEGYDAAQLAELNRRYDERIATYSLPDEADELGLKAVLDHVAECVLADFDSETA